MDVRNHKKRDENIIKDDRSLVSLKKQIVKQLQLK